MVTFAAGFATGWLTRSTIDSSKSAVVQLVAFGVDAVARMKRAMAIERERLEDLVAEAHDAVARRQARRTKTHAEETPVENAA
jgi:hypothetical protein